MGHPSPPRDMGEPGLSHRTRDLGHEVASPSSTLTWAHTPVGRKIYFCINKCALVYSEKDIPSEGAVLACRLPW